MAEILVPTLGESVTEATVAQWLKQVGDTVNVDDPIVELETDKVTLEVNATEAGVLGEIIAEEGDNVEVNAVLGVISTDGAAAAPKAAKKEEKPVEAPKAEPEAAKAPAAPVATDSKSGPAARKMMAENNVSEADISGSAKGGRVTKEDIQNYLETPKKKAAPQAPAGNRPNADREERVKMTRLRKVIASRLKGAQDTAAMLTTFNEIDMTNVMALRNEYKDDFLKKHGTKLGFMSFFTKAAIYALKEIPAVNAEIEGDDLVYKNYYDIGIAVGTPQGLVVPVVRDADQLSFAGIESTIAGLGAKARDGKLSMADMTGGTFTISNGGVYGSLMSTPILNPPQSGILGLHKVQQRPVAVDGKVEIRPMMYVALSYDHRIIDGREAVTFLVRLKDAIEDPRRLLLDM